MNPDLSLIIPYLACYFRELPSELPLFFKEASAYVHLGPFHKIELVVLLQYVRANLANVKHLVVIDV